ncbi:MAG: beta-ketoacyl-[acyl-carrier-protein] synthase family protein [Actinomycetota bacterium]|nr:beta-ketoacyl-[acyl-carrier-protein] synthase family protein [Actinomycetota bacterium]
MDNQTASFVQEVLNRDSVSSVRAVVTGVGAVTPLGVGVDSLMSRWIDGECGIHDGVGRCTEFDPADVLSSKELRRGDRYTHLALAAAAEAIEGAGWAELPYPPERISCVMGTGIGGLVTFEENFEVLRDGGPDRVPPLMIPTMIPNASAASVAIRYGFQGEVFGVVSACASSAHAIGAGLRVLATRTTDAVVVGGSDAPHAPLIHAGCVTMGAASRLGVSRPFDRRRDGFILSEGAGALVLEKPATAARRGASVLGEIAGYGATCDAFHLTAPHPTGEPAERAMRLALDDAGLEPDDVDYINAHGTSTQLNDRTETLSIKAVMGKRAHRVPVSSTKSAVGHLLGGAGVVEAVATLAALRLRIAPPTLGLEEPEEGLDLNYVQGVAQPLPPPEEKATLVGLSNAFGFGGHNAVVALRA